MNHQQTFHKETMDENGNELDLSKDASHGKQTSLIETPMVNDVEDIKTVTYFQGKPIRQQWFMVISHGHLPMMNAPTQRNKRLDELKSIAKSILQTNSQERRKLMMKITNNDHDECGSLELKFYLPKLNTFQYKVDCRRIDLFKRSKKDRTFFYFTVLHDGPSMDNHQATSHYECQIYHSLGMSNAEFIANLMEKQIEINLKELKLSTKIFQKKNKALKAIEPNRDVEKARGCIAVSREHNSGGDHPLDESLEDTANNVPTLLDLHPEPKSSNPFLTANESLSDIFSTLNEPKQNDPFSWPPVNSNGCNNFTNISTEKPRFEDDFQTFISQRMQNSKF